MTQLPPPGPPGTPPPMAMPAAQAVAPQTMATAPSTLFAGLNEADATEDGVWIRPGHYIMRNNMMKGGTSKKPGGGDYLVTELTVCKVLGTGEAIEAGTEPHRVGELVTDMKMRKHQSYLRNVNAQLAGMEGMTLDALKADLARSNKTIEALASEALTNQPYAGRFFEVTARHVQTQTMKMVVNPVTGVPEQKPGTFTRITYVRPVPASELAQLMTAEEQEGIFPEGVLAGIIATESAVNQAMGVATGAPAAAPATPAAAAPAGASVVAMAGVNYLLPAGWQTREDAPGQGWDGAAWHPLSPA